MKKNDKRNNLVYLLKNKENIARNYLKVDKRLLETIANDNHEKFNAVAGNNSTDGFLKGIMDNYIEFSDELFDLIKSTHASEIESMQKEFHAPTPTPTPQPQEQPQKKGGTRRTGKLTVAEKNRIKILVKSGKSRGQIIKSINDKREKEGKTKVRTSAIKQQIRKVNRKNEN